MIEKNNESSPKSNDSVKQENENESPNFKLLYRKTPNPERDRSSGVSSDDETTSSSLVPIPESLKILGNTTKWTMSETGDHSDTPYACGILDSTGNIMNSLEELRRKYTLKNEASVTLKMNSANQMLDDILNSANLKGSLSSNPQYRSFKKEDYLPKTSPESETSTTDSSGSRREPCACVADLSHLPIALDFYNPPCHRHYSATQVLHSSLSAKDKDRITSSGNLDINQRKKSLVEKLQDLQIRCRIQSVYKNLQKTRNPFTKFKKDPESLNPVSQGMNRMEAESLNVSQGIPGCDGDTLTDAEQPVCQCELVCPLSQFSKKMVLDLVEPSDMSQSDSRSTEREDRHLTYLNHRRCTCPEVLPRCACRELSYQVSETCSESTRQNSEFASKTEEQIQTTQSVTALPAKNENETSFLVEKENEETKTSKHSLGPNKKGWKKYCSKERNLIERTDIYYFDHGNSAYYKTTDNHPMRYTECLVERTDEYATKFWAEFFGTIEIGIAFLISFVLQLYRFLFTSLIRSLTVGLLQIFSDYFFKPLLAIIFNGLIQPCLILVYNITTSIRDLCLPISQMFGFFAKELANIMRACRLVEVNQPKEASCICGNKV